METTLISQMQVFLFSIFLGVALGAFYDVFRIFRLAFNCRNSSILFQDIFYFLISGLATFLFVLAYNFGETRFYIVAGEIIGFCIYQLTIGKLVIRCSSLIILLIKKILRIINKFIFSPILSFLVKIMISIRTFFHLIGRNLKNILLN